MGKMTAEKAAKMLAEDGVIVTNEEAAVIVDFLRNLAKIAVAQYLREDEQASHPNTENINQKLYKTSDMLTVDLLLDIRVSTDEQADRGYSQRDQEERLRKYCDHNQLDIRRVIYEDHSAKTFERPEWKRLLLDLKRHKGQIDLILFTKWDRFSRNAGDAYQMINTLRKVGVEPQAIEQPLDMSVPESKIMMAVYLAAPEVENDRRALNVINGMRRARKEGRWMGPAPKGYTNKSKENGDKYIAINEDEAIHLRWAFQEIAQGFFNTEQIWKMALQKGLKCSKHNFWLAIKNPVYCGKITLSINIKMRKQGLFPGNMRGLFQKNCSIKSKMCWMEGVRPAVPKFSPSTNFRYGVFSSAQLVAEC